MDAREAVDDVYRLESRRVLATLIRLLGDFDRAEEAMHEAFVAAVEQWGREGVPAHPRAWLVSTGRFRAIDTARRRARFDRSLAQLARELGDRAAAAPADAMDQDLDDDRLRLVFTCCHPALTPDAQVARRGSPTRCRPARNCLRVWIHCFASSIWFSMKAIRHPAAVR